MELRDNTDRAQWILAVFYLLLAVTVVSIGSNYLELRLVQEPVFTPEEANANDTRQMIIGILQLVLHISAWVFFILWFRRAYYNLHAVGRRMEFTEGWAAGAWFVPLLNLVRPYQIMREIWVDTQLASYDRVEKDTSLVGWWWAIFLINNFVSNIAGRLYRDSGTLEQIQTASTWMIVSDIIEIGALLVVIHMIRETRTMERDLYRGNREVAIEDHLI